MANQFNLELISPERTAVQKPVLMVNVPSENGYYGVLAGHAPMMTTIKPGVIEVYEKDEKTITDRFFVSGGFAKVTQESCVLLTEGLIDVDKIDQAEALKEKKALVEAFEKAESEEDHKRLELNLSVACAKVDAFS